MASQQLELVPPLPLVGFLRDPLPRLQWTKKGSSVARHMLPYWAPARDTNRELNQLVAEWVKAYG